MKFICSSAKESVRPIMRLFLYPDLLGEPYFDIYGASWRRLTEYHDVFMYLLYFIDKWIKEISNSDGIINK